ncbi:MAG: alpha-amylase, partial [Bacteroidota bacterium]
MKNLFFGILIVLSVTSCADSHNNAKSGPMSNPVLPEWASDAVLYECNIRQFSPEGNLAGVTAQIPRLKELGIDILWLMPVHP